jgi:hypothetical protein
MRICFISGEGFFKLIHVDVTERTYIRSWIATEIITLEKCGLLAVPLTVPVEHDALPDAAQVRPWVDSQAKAYVLC